MLALASHTGWQLSELKSLPVSEFVFYCEGLKRDGE